MLPGFPGLCMNETVSTIIRVMPRGGGFPSLVETISGQRYIMKLAGVGQGASGLLTEFVAMRLASALGLRVPRGVPIMLSSALPWQVGTDEFYDALQRSSGWNLGVQFIDAARDLTADDLAHVPAQFLDRLAAVDALLQNMDRTKENPNLLRDSALEYWAIDFGACQFLNRFARYRQGMTFELPSNHFLAARPVQCLRLDKVHETLRKIVLDVPNSWFGSGNRESLLDDLNALTEAYSKRLG
jgi:HipA-like protein